MSEREALLRAICETPADDTARLVFADWLQENGEEERAGYIRKQIATGEIVGFVAGFDSMGWFPGTHELGEKATVKVSRGFATQLHVPCDVFMEHAAGLFSRHPIVKVALTDFGSDVFRNRGKYGGLPAGEYPLIRVNNIGFKRHRSGIGSRDHVDYLPVEFAPLLQRGRTTGPYGDRWYSDHEEANTDLSDACVAFGRRFAGLSPLPKLVPGAT